MDGAWAWYADGVGTQAARRVALVARLSGCPALKGLLDTVAPMRRPARRAISIGFATAT